MGIQLLTVSLKVLKALQVVGVVEDPVKGANAFRDFSKPQGDQPSFVTQ